MIGALLAGGVSLISGLFGRSGAKKRAKAEEAAIAAANAKAEELAATMNREIRARADAAALVPVQNRSVSSSYSTSGVNADQFMADAESMGFNPLTYLRSGALGMYGHTLSTTDSFSCTTGQFAMDAALAGQHIPSLQPVIAQTQVPSVGEVFGNALQAGAGQYLADLNQQEQNNFQRELANAYLKGANNAGTNYNASGMGRSFNVPNTIQTGGGKVDNLLGNIFMQGIGRGMTANAGDIDRNRYGDEVPDAQGWYNALYDYMRSRELDIASNGLTVRTPIGSFDWGPGVGEIWSGYLKPFLERDRMELPPDHPVYNNPASRLGKGGGYF